MLRTGFPSKQGLYDPAWEHDACGVGFIADLHGKPSHKIVEDSLEILLRMDHRGGAGADPKTGDGAGVLLQIPHELLHASLAAEQNIELPPSGEYGVGMLFLSGTELTPVAWQQTFAAAAAAEGLSVLAWRFVPVDTEVLSAASLAAKPHICQVILPRPRDLGQAAFERKLYLLRRSLEKQWQAKGFYAASLSSRTIVYKGMLTPEQLSQFFLDLSNPALKSALALVHSRFSTNTFPSWARAHPTRCLAHNGEINTLRGNVHWMNARQGSLQSELFGSDLQRIYPVIQADGSDSSMLDNTLEFLHLNGYELPHALMMMIPEPWSRSSTMSPERQSFYQYHSCLMEPWDGPAVIAFCSGTQIGATLDRNGLRPARYYVTKDDRVIMASEVGVLDVAPENVQYKGRLQPGKMLLVDIEQGKLIGDSSLKQRLASAKPYSAWLEAGLLSLDALPQPPVKEFTPQSTLLQRQKAFGYTYEELRLILTPLAQDANEPVGSMGADIPLAVLSAKPQPLFNYFKQLFAQVTNPPIDSIREELITSSDSYLGSEGNLLLPGPENCRRIHLPSPVLTDAQLAKVRYLEADGFRTAGLSLLFPVGQTSASHNSLEAALESLFERADAALEAGANILLLTDRGVSREQAAIPSLLAVAGLHHHLIRRQKRTQTSIVLESGEPREVHHFAVLLGYGVDAINPYLALETLRHLGEQGQLEGLSYEQSVQNYRKAVVKGVIKIMAKMGISVVQSYRGAQIFEALGLHSDVIERYFTGTASRIGGITLPIIAAETLRRHRDAFAPIAQRDQALVSGGIHQYRRDGEKHLYNPKTIHKLQTAVRNQNYDLFKEYTVEIHQNQPINLRSLLRLRSAGELERQPLPVEQVESVEKIVHRFKTGAMSYGSLSKEAHECLAIAMNRLGGRSNSGEGGEDPERFQPDPNGDLRCSAIKQVASGRFGVTSPYLVSAKEIQIKMAQGAKPGEGGQLPGKKVYPWVAKTRHSTPGVGLISPPPHHDIYSIEDLAQLIHDLKNANCDARVSVKLVSAVGVGTIAAGTAKGRADVILISGGDGGTGASPRTSIQHAGLPWELGLAETHQTLLLNGLRSRVAVETDGKLMTGRDIAVAALLGAEEFGFATLPLVALGCVMMRVCNLDTCPVGVATQNPELRKNFKGDPEHVVTLMRFLAQDLREIMAELGYGSIDEMVGQSQALAQTFPEVDDELLQSKIATLDLSSLLYAGQQWAVQHPGQPQGQTQTQDHRLDMSLDRRELFPLCQPAIHEGKSVTAELPIQNTDRVVGTMVGAEITRRYGALGLPQDTIQLTFYGSAGQSFGAFLPRGMTLHVQGDANDYFGKGLSGGTVIVSVPDKADYEPAENVIIGNTALYGATAGKAFVEGRAGERFCVRNSGVQAVVEGLGDHGCEYMTGGKVIILGSIGRNFAAGMSGGTAFIWDPDRQWHTGVATSQPVRQVPSGILLESHLAKEELADLQQLIKEHQSRTGSQRAAAILADWEQQASCFVKVIPQDYRRMMQAIEHFEARGLHVEDAFMAAFEENSRDLDRVSGS